MFQIDKLIYREPNFLSKENCNRLINSFYRDEAMYEISSHATTKETLQSSFEAYSITPDKKEAFNFVKKATNQALNNYWKYLKSSGNFHYSAGESLRYSHKYRILKYNTGASIHPHIDFSPFTYASIVFNLNEDYKGGEFSFFNGKFDLNLKQGELMIFPASPFWVHEVKEIIEGTRYSVNSFILGIPVEVKDKLLEDALTQEQEYLNKVPFDKILGPYKIDN